MTRRVAWAVALAWAFASPARADWVSPGPLASAHADLDQSDRCDKCHDPGAGVSARRCVACHEHAAGPPAARETWHFREQVKGSGKACADCHRDHKGRTYPLIRWTPPADFDHKTTGFVLDGAHRGLDCGACHSRQPRYLGLKPACVSCHKDPHGGQLGACTGCHTTASFLPPAFDHAKARFPLEGRHTSIACASCHRARPDGKPHYKPIAHGRCADCHKDPHQGRTFLSDCSSCHEVGGWQKTRGLPPAHEPSGWPLVGKHAPVACADCHGTDLGRRVETACASCHADPHAGRFGGDCARCHDERGWKQQKPGSFDHGLTRFPLRGRHAGVKCAKCHAPKGGTPVYKGIPFGRCEDCHADPHRMTFASAATCASCHDEQGFSPATFGLVEHERARWPLTGSHRAARCEACHKREPGGIPQLAVADTRCVACHKSPHGEQFVKTITERGCEACHSTRGFRASAFDHEATRFPLRGAHANAACASCHRGNPIQYEGLPLSCEGCHVDVHRGQFRTTARARPCTDCHGSDSFRIPILEGEAADWHLRVTGSPLDGAHEKVACARCHPTVELGAEVVHWRLGPKGCADCHQNPHARGDR
ncbi:MAG: hypothetical protein AMXMBFR64_08090 [Myxococcales bacterium]